MKFMKMDSLVLRTPNRLGSHRLSGAEVSTGNEVVKMVLIFFGQMLLRSN